MTRTSAAAAALACLTALTGCVASEGRREQDCRPSGSAVVRAVGPGGAWTARTAATEDPPSIGGGYVLVRHSCGWTALDLADGAVVREGDGHAVGIASGFVFTRNEVDNSVIGEPVVEGGTVDGYRRMIVGSNAAILAQAVDDRLYVVDGGGGGPATVTQHVGPAVRGWDAVLPVVRQPTLTTVGTTLVVTSADGSVYGLDTSTGRVRWRALAPTLEGTVILRVRALDDQVVLTTWESAGVDGPGKVVVLDAVTGERLERVAAPDSWEPQLEASADGWQVTVRSEPAPMVMEE